MLKAIINIISIISFGGIMYSQTQTSTMKNLESKTTDTCFTICNYQICPQERKIKIFQMTGGVDWDGYTYTSLDNLDYGSTKMYFVGKALLFEEQINGRDMKKAHFIYPRKYWMNYRNIPTIAFDNDSLFEVSHSGISARMSTKGKKYLRDNLFEDEAGKLYLLSDYHTNLSDEIPESLGIDKATIRNICDDFYYDKNRIYYLGYYEEEACPKMKCFGKVVSKNEGNNFKVGTSYLTINNQTILRAKYVPKPLDLNASTVKEYLLDTYYSTYLITDGNKVYINSLHYQGTDFMEIEGLKNLDLQPIIPTVGEWRYNPSNKMVYLYTKDGKTVPNTKGEYGFLMYSNINNKVFIINRDGKYKTFAGILILEKDSKTFATFDRKKDADTLKNLEIYTVYKYNSIFYEALLAAYKANGIDNDKLKQVGKSIFYTDGKNLVWMNKVLQINQNYGKEGVGHIDYYFKNWICHINKPNNLKVINDDMLTDGTTLYYIDTMGRNDKLMAVSFTEMGIPIFYLEDGKDKIYGQK